MQLLISVRTAAEAAAALAGGADIIDAKDPAAGSLGRVTAAVLRHIHARVHRASLISAALGDALDEDAIERDAAACATVGVSFVKIGLAGTTSADRAASLLAAARRGVRRGARSGRRHCGVVAVAYGDAAQAGSLPPFDVVDVAAREGMQGVLLDTADKRGPSLRGLMSEQEIAAWVKAAHARRLHVALAGKLTAGDLSFVRRTGADIAGVRGAACSDGRNGPIVAARVRLLAAQR